MSHCFYCRRTLNDRRTARRNDRNTGLDFTKDHKIPLCRGGENNRTNIVPCCFRCNNLKSNMNAEEFFNHIARFGYERVPSMLKHAR